ncbi:MAG: ribosome biogenesis GTPase YlqF [Ruminococcaceae bacterium]|nr:ribosome biogenesis GTPase YlqF [Oscillospiraceae bacterium]
MNLQWFPGHMTKTRRMIQENLKLVDLIIELVDARLPLSSRNPEIDALVGQKPRLLLLNKADIADQNATDAWVEYFKQHGVEAMRISSVADKSLKMVLERCRALLSEQIARQKERGLVGRSIKLMVVGVPNVGKSSFINKLSGKKSAQVGDRPGVTRGKQWIRLQNGFELLDTPGILWPKFEDEQVGMYLAYTGAIKDDIMDVEELSCHLLELLATRYPQCLAERYKMDDVTDKTGYELLELLGRKRGFVVSGGEIDTLRAANILLDEFRAAKLGRISLEMPEK